MIHVPIVEFAIKIKDSSSSSRYFNMVDCPKIRTLGVKALEKTGRTL